MSDVDFRWEQFFQRSRDPLFVLNRQQYLLFVNHAFEQLTGVSADQVKRLYCAIPQAPPSDAPRDKILAFALTPPPEALAGETTRRRRLVPGPDEHGARWWDIDFLTLNDETGFRGLVGKITLGPEVLGPTAVLLPEEALILRQKMLERLSRIHLDSRVPSVRRLREQVRLAAATTACVALVGPAGAGKKTLARLIHFAGPRREQSIACVDCRRLPGFAIGALLWGESGAAARSSLGAIYLQEPAALPREIQERLLLWLREQQRRDGAPRLLAGCTTEPAEATRQGLLLDELAHELSTLKIEVPSLRERRDDLPHLVDRLLQRFEEEEPRGIHALTADAWEIVLAYSWPGNLRELVEVLRQARRRTTKDVLDAPDLPGPLRLQVRVGAVPTTKNEAALPMRTLLEQTEQRLIELALKRSRGNRRKAARLLGVHVPWLYKRLREMGLIELEADIEEAQ